MSCPICNKDADPKYRPFCSRRCADVDLGKWFSESYALPASADDPETKAAQTPDDETEYRH